MALPSWKERTARVTGPIPVDPMSYTTNVPIGNCSPTNVQARIYDTPGNTPLNTPMGGLFELPGRDIEDYWKDSWFKGSQANY